MSQNILTNTTTPPLAGSMAIGVINLAADSLAKWFCGPAAPTALAAGLTGLGGFVWHDTSANQLKVRDQADTAWIVAGYFDETGKTFTPHINPAAAYAADAGAANAYVVNPSPAWPSYAAGGPLIAFAPANTNTGAATINISGAGAQPILRRDGSALAAGDIVAGQLAVGLWNPVAGALTLLTQRLTPPAYGKAAFSALVCAATAAGGSSASAAADEVLVKDAAGNATLLTGFSQSVTLTLSGAGGLDAGSPAASTWYALWAIYDPATAAAALIASLSSASPSLPAGYTQKARLGWALTDAYAHIAPFRQAGRRGQWLNTGAGLPLMASGASGSMSTPTWSPVALAGFVPPTASRVQVELSAANYGAMVAPSSAYGAYNSTTNPPLAYAGVPSGEAQIAVEMLIEGPDVYWASNGATTWLRCIGWEDNL